MSAIRSGRLLKWGPSPLSEAISSGVRSADCRRYVHISSSSSELDRGFKCSLFMMTVSEFSDTYAESSLAHIFHSFWNLWSRIVLTSCCVKLHQPVLMIIFSLSMHTCAAPPLCQRLQVTCTTCCKSLEGDVCVLDCLMLFQSLIFFQRWMQGLNGLSFGRFQRTSILWMLLA